MNDDVRRQVLELYREVDAQVAAAGPVCVASGRCCRFKEHGHVLYVSNLEGDTFVLAASPKFKQLAKNTLGEPLYAAPAAVDGKLLLRTHKHLYCIGKQ